METDLMDLGEDGVVHAQLVKARTFLFEVLEQLDESHEDNCHHDQCQNELAATRNTRPTCLAHTTVDLGQPKAVHFFTLSAECTPVGTSNLSVRKHEQFQRTLHEQPQIACVLTSDIERTGSHW
jgi:hypothetical protein